MSRIILRFPLATFLSLFAALGTCAKSWRQITPAHSTAKEVVTRFQACQKAETRCQFTLEDHEVMIIFSGRAIGLSGITTDVAECEQVPKQTVLAVIITYNAPKRLRGFQVNNKHFRAFDPSSPPGAGFKTYYDAEDGFMINTYKGRVVGLVYVAAQRDIHLCPEYYADPKAFVEVGLFP